MLDGVLYLFSTMIKDIWRRPFRYFLFFVTFVVVSFAITLAVATTIDASKDAVLYLQNPAHEVRLWIDNEKDLERITNAFDEDVVSYEVMPIRELQIFSENKNAIFPVGYASASILDRLGEKRNNNEVYIKPYHMRPLELNDGDTITIENHTFSVRPLSHGVDGDIAMLMDEHSIPSHGRYTYLVMIELSEKTDRAQYLQGLGAKTGLRYHEQRGTADVSYDFPDLLLQENRKRSYNILRIVILVILLIACFSILQIKDYMSHYLRADSTAHAFARIYLGNTGLFFYVWFRMFFLSVGGSAFAVMLLVWLNQDVLVGYTMILDNCLLVFCSTLPIVLFGVSLLSFSCYCSMAKKTVVSILKRQ